MRRVLLFSSLLISGLIGSQLLPLITGEQYDSIRLILQILARVCLAFIMIHVGLAFNIDKNNLKGYAWDWIVASFASLLPWVLCATYFMFFILNTTNSETGEKWRQALLAGLFAAPTSAGVLFTMLAAAGLGATWLFQKARLLAIFDDLVTILLMIPLKILIIGFQWELIFVMSIITLLLSIAWRYMHSFPLPTNWHWILSYAISVTLLTEFLSHIHHFGAGLVPIEVEVLLPAFVLGVTILRGRRTSIMDANQALLEEKQEAFIARLISGIFLLLVGLSMPPILSTLSLENGDSIPWKTLFLHVFLVTCIINAGKMFPTFCYRKEASLKERVALGIGMWPRGEVGAGVIFVTLSFGMKGPMIAIAILSLALNLIFTGVFIAIVKLLLSKNSNIPQN